MFGIVVILVVLLVAGPIGIMLGGAAWSALAGQGLADEADETAKTAESAH